MPISFTIKIPPDIDRDEFLRELLNENADSNTSTTTSEIITITKKALAQVALVSQEMDRILDDQLHAKYDNVLEGDTDHSQNVNYCNNSTTGTIGVEKEPSMGESSSSISWEKKEEGICFKPNSIGTYINHRLLDQKRLRSKVKKSKKQSATSNLDEFEERFQQLIEFKSIHGHVHVPTRYPDNQPLSDWCRNMKSEYQLWMKGGTSSIGMNSNHVKQLKTIGLIDKKLARSHVTFEERLQELNEFLNEHGHVNVPITYTKNQGLANWCHNLRAAYKLWRNGKTKKIRLTHDRVKLLEDMGFKWKLKRGKCRRQVPCGWS